MKILSILGFLLVLRADRTAGFAPSFVSRPSTFASFASSPRSRSNLHMSVPNFLDTFTSGLVSICRLPYGVTVSSDLKPATTEEQPRLAVLYDIETSTACRAVRERITELDLVVEKVVPAASNSRVFLDVDCEYYLPEAAEIPRLVAVEQGEQKAFVGDADIISYLNACFAAAADRDDDDDDEDERDLKDQVVSVLTTVGSYVAPLLRLGRGTSVAPAAAFDKQPSVPRPEKPLVLYSYEGNQFCRLVREVLTELDLVYELRSAGKESPRRTELAEITGGSTQCPLFIDPNTSNKPMPESAEIIRYLYKTYALWTPPNELLQFASNVVLPIFRPVFSALAPLQAGSMTGDEYDAELAKANAQIAKDIGQASVVMYTYGLSPFSFEAKALLENLDIAYTEVSLGLEWIPGLIAQGGSAKRAALLDMTGQSSLPHVFIGGVSIGGLFSGTPGLVPALEEGVLLDMVAEAKEGKDKSAPVSAKKNVDTDSTASIGEFE